MAQRELPDPEMKTPDPEEAPPGVEVDLSEDDDDDEPAPTTADPSVRQEKKRERGNLRREIDDLRLEKERERADYERRLGEIQQQVYQARQPATPQEFPEDKELADIEAANQILIEKWNLLGARATEDDRKKFAAEAQKLDDRKFEARAAKRDRARAPTPAQLQAQQRTQAITARHSDVFANQKASGWALRRYHDAMDDGHPDSQETVDQVMDQARKKFGIGGRRPDPNMGRKLAGMPSAGGRGASSPKVFLSKAEEGMADAMYGKSIPDEKERYRYYYKTIASKARGHDA
jgi:hypothetical protein